MGTIGLTLAPSGYHVVFMIQRNDLLSIRNTVTSPWKLAPRPIPALPEGPDQFDGVVEHRGSVTREQWSAFV